MCFPSNVCVHCTVCMLFQGDHRDWGFVHDLKGHVTYPSAIGLGNFLPIASLPSIPTILPSSPIFTTITPVLALTPDVHSSLLQSLSLSAAPQVLSLPPKSVKKILDLKFIEMSELLSDTWRLQEKEIGIKMLSPPPRATQRPCEIYVDMDRMLLVNRCYPVPRKDPSVYVHVKAHRTFVKWLSLYTHDSVITGHTILDTHPDT